MTIPRYRDSRRVQAKSEVIEENQTRKILSGFGQVILPISDKAAIRPQARRLL
jgi:hypothetical protein